MTSYDHSAPRIIEKMTAVGTNIYRTDQQGAVHYYYFNDRWWIETVK